MSTETLTLPSVVIRGRSFMALIVSPEPPLENWFAVLDQQMQRSAGFFADRPIIANLAPAVGVEEGLEAVLDALDEREFRIIGVEGIDPVLLEGTRWERLPKLAQVKDAGRVLEVPDDPKPDAPQEAAPVALQGAPSLLIDRPVRSGQSIFFEDGDVTVIGSVASGAEVIAGGSIHVYGALRGRAIAGLKTGAEARIFCRKLTAELVAIDGLYHTPEHWGEDFHGRAVQIRLEKGALKLAGLD